MSKRPALKDSLTAIAAKRQNSISPQSDAVKAAKSDVEESIPHAASGTKPSSKEVLPKMTLYAHRDVLKAVRRLAVDDGVQSQVILRTALQDYLAKRGHHFTDLATGK